MAIDFKKEYEDLNGKTIRDDIKYRSLNISKDNCNTEGNYNTMIKWKFEKINDKFYRFICKRKENDNIL